MSDVASPVETPSIRFEPKPAPPERQPRVWPAVIIVLLTWAVITVPKWIGLPAMTQFMGMMWGPMIGALLLGAWWLFASRVRWVDRLLFLVLFAALCVGAWFIADDTLHPMGFLIYAIPIGLTAPIAWLVVTPFLNWPARRWGLLGVTLLAWGYSDVIRFDGVDGEFNGQLAWRWSQTAEEKFLAEYAGKEPVNAAQPDGTLKLQPGDWPSFRGPNRDGRLKGVRIKTDWDENPPKLLWKRLVGPGWSSFAVVGNRIYTQDQRGEKEVVVCYNADTGDELWTHKDDTRFYEKVAGPGPRATPTFHEGKIYAQGANGTLNCLDAATGVPVWTVEDIRKDSGAELPIWGFSSSPLVVDGVVTVFAGGPDKKAVLGYDAATGKLLWTAGDGKSSYSSTHLARLGGVEQVLIETDEGLTSLRPKTGEVLWHHNWPVEMKGMARIVQPTVVNDSDVLIATWMDQGTRRVRVKKENDKWATEEVWTSKAINTYFNDVVVYEDHIYGPDNGFLTCLSLADGKNKWKARGYGAGQVLLLEDQGLLLVLSEKGEAVLVKAKPDGHERVGRFKALEGKTWNHPVVAHGKLFVRNGEQAACYQLTEVKDGDATGR